MKILIEIVHPAQVHLFKNAIFQLKDQGHDVMVTSRHKEMTTELLDRLHIPHMVLSAKRHSLFSSAIELILRSLEQLKLFRRHRPDAVIALCGAAVGPLCWWYRVPMIAVDEAEHAWMQRFLTIPFARYVLVGDGYLKPKSENFVTYSGYWMQSYLDPQYFQPDQDVIQAVKSLGQKPRALVRLVEHSANHDIGSSVVTWESIRACLSRLEQHYQVFLSSERPLPDDLRRMELPCAADDIHSLLASVDVVIGDSATMVGEAVCLGVPAIYFGRLRWGYLEDMAVRGLMLTAVSFEEAANLALSTSFQQRRPRKLSPATDIPQLMCTLVSQL